MTRAAALFPISSPFDSAPGADFIFPLPSEHRVHVARPSCCCAVHVALSPQSECAHGAQAVRDAEAREAMEIAEAVAAVERAMAAEEEELARMLSEVD